MNLNKHKPGRLASREGLAGWLFLLPLLFGLLVFFVIPAAKSLLFSFSDVVTGARGYSFTLKGIDAYKRALTEHNSYRQTVVGAVRDMLLTSPLCLIFSFFLASVLNQKFRGRTFFRVVLFLPVIISVSMGSSALEGQMSSFSGYKDAFDDNAVSLTQQISNYLLSAGVSQDISGAVIGVVNQIYSVVRLSGIQILILLVGMQSISPSLYEAAKVEGGTAWENFWKITFPMITPLIFTSAVYTVVDSFTSQSNRVIMLITQTSLTGRDMAQGAAMAWLYFAAVALFLGLLAFAVSRYMFYYDD